MQRVLDSSPKRDKEGHSDSCMGGGGSGLSTIPSIYIKASIYRIFQTEYVFHAMLADLSWLPLQGGRTVPLCLGGKTGACQCLEQRQLLVELKVRGGVGCHGHESSS